MKCKKRRDSSWLWVGILKTRSLLPKGLCYKVGKGDSIDFWVDPLIPKRPNFLPNPRNDSCELFGMVNSLKLENGEWDEDKLNRFFDQDSIKCIK